MNENQNSGIVIQKKHIIIAAVVIVLLLAYGIFVGANWNNWFGAKPEAPQSNPPAAALDTYYILADPKLDKDNTSDSTQVEYNVDATYMVTIPAKVTLKSDEEAEASVKAEKVKLAKGQQVIVKLTGAKNVVDGEDVNDTATDKKFSAKTADGRSTATYTIKDADSKQVGLNDTVASFETKEEEVTKKLTFSKAEGATYAGEHTETLTFTLSVGEAAETKTITVDGYTFTFTEGQTWGDIIDSLPDGVRYDDEYEQFQKDDGKILAWADNRSHQEKRMKQSSQPPAIMIGMKMPNILHTNCALVSRATGKYKKGAEHT